MTHEPENAPRRYPYDPWEDLDYDEALDDLFASKKEGEPHLPTFARYVLKRLMDTGLLHRTDTGPLVNVRKARLDKDQELWIRFDTYRSDEGYLAVDVVDTPRSDMAILAAMIAWLAESVDFRRVLDALPYALAFQRVLSEMEQEEATEGAAKAVSGNEDLGFGEIVSFVNATSKDMAVKMEPLKHLDYLLPLVRYYRPGFDKLLFPEQLELLEKTCSHTNDFLESLRKLQAFLEYGTPKGKLAPPIKEPKRDVRAAILRDVDGQNYRQIGERLGVALPPDFEIKGEHQTVRKMVERGRGILVKAFGKEGWRERAETMKAEKARWWSLSEEEQYKEREVEWVAFELGLPVEEARRWVERRRS